jgi:hypothetical protein
VLLEANGSIPGDQHRAVEQALCVERIKPIAQAMQGFVGGARSRVGRRRKVVQVWCRSLDGTSPVSRTMLHIIKGRPAPVWPPTHRSIAIEPTAGAAGSIRSDLAVRSA